MRVADGRHTSGIEVQTSREERVILSCAPRDTLRDGGSPGFIRRVRRWIHLAATGAGGEPPGLCKSLRWQRRLPRQRKERQHGCLNVEGVLLADAAQNGRLCLHAVACGAPVVDQCHCEATVGEKGEPVLEFSDESSMRTAVWDRHEGERTCSGCGSSTPQQKDVKVRGVARRGSLPRSTQRLR